MGSRGGGGGGPVVWSSQYLISGGDHLNRKYSLIRIKIRTFT